MRSFWIIAIALLLWAILGDAAYLMQVTANLDALARTDPITADAFRSMPRWAWAAYAVGVGAGTAGAAALLLRRRIAAALFGVSLVMVLVQFGWTFLGFGLVAKKGAGTLVFPLMITAIALASTLYAQAKIRDGTLR